MARKKSGWLSQFERKVAYDRDTFIEICKRYLRGEQLSEICKKPPMPVAQCFLSWVQNNEEARDIWECARKFESDRALAKELGAPMNSGISDWADAVYDKLEHGYSLSNYQRHAYIMPEWRKLYSKVGDPPVWGSENLQDYEDLLKEITQLLKPRDIIELIYTKEMVDAIWEEKRESREKNSLPERQYQLRLSEAHAVRVVEASRRNLPMPKPAAPEPATALDHIRGFRTGFKTYQALDRAQCRKKQRRDNAPRQIRRWRDSFGGKAEVLPDRFVAELALAERDGVLSDTQTDDLPGESMQADPSPAPAGKVVQPDPSPVPGCETVNGPLAHTEEVAPAATSVALPDAIAQSASGGDPANAAQSVPAADQAKAPESGSLVADTAEPARAPTDNGPEALSPPVPVEKTAQVAPTASGANGQVALPPAPAQESAQTEAEGASKIEPAHAAPPRVPAHEVEVKMGGVTERINFVAWLWGAKRYPWDRLETACEKAFGGRFTSKRALVRYLVLECKMVRPDEVGAELAPWLRESATGPAASGANGQAAHPLAPAQKTARTMAAGAFQKKPTAAAPPRTPAHEVEIEVMGHTYRIDWIAFLKGTQLYPNLYLIKAGEKAFKRTFTSKCALLRKLVLECKMVAPDQLSPEHALLVSRLEPRRMPRPAPREARI